MIFASNLRPFLYAKDYGIVREPTLQVAYSQNVEDILYAWYSIFNEIINAHVPLKQKRVGSESKPKWLSPNIVQLMRSRDHLLKKAKRSNDPLDW